MNKLKNSFMDKKQSLFLKNFGSMAKLLDKLKRLFILKMNHF